MLHRLDADHLQAPSCMPLQVQLGGGGRVRHERLLDTTESRTRIGGSKRSTQQERSDLFDRLLER